jgi:hypothetical protein
MPTITKICALVLLAGIIIVSMSPTASARGLVKQSVTGDTNQSTAGISFLGSAVVIVKSASFVGTVTLQVSADNGTSYTDVTTYTSETVEAITAGGGLTWRLICKTGEYTSGSCQMIIKADQ